MKHGTVQRRVRCFEVFLQVTGVVIEKPTVKSRWSSNTYYNSRASTQGGWRQTASVLSQGGNFTALGGIFLSFLLICQEFDKLKVFLPVRHNDPQRSLKIDRPFCVRGVMGRQSPPSPLYMTDSVAYVSSVCYSASAFICSQCRALWLPEGFCLSVCLSVRHVPVIVSRWMKIRSCGFQHLVGQSL